MKLKADKYFTKIINKIVRNNFSKVINKIIQKN